MLGDLNRIWTWVLSCLSIRHEYNLPTVQRSISWRSQNPLEESYIRSVCWEQRDAWFNYIVSNYFQVDNLKLYKNAWLIRMYTFLLHETFKTTNGTRWRNPNFLKNFPFWEKVCSLWCIIEVSKVPKLCLEVEDNKNTLLQISYFSCSFITQTWVIMFVWGNIRNTDPPIRRFKTFTYFKVKMCI